MKSRGERVETWVWVLIYGGLFVCGLGVALSRSGLDHAWTVSVAGIVLALGGAALIWVRSRMSDRGDA